jgi:hypothetical protein
VELIDGHWACSYCIRTLKHNVCLFLCSHLVRFQLCRMVTCTSSVWYSLRDPSFFFLMIIRSVVISIFNFSNRSLKFYSHGLKKCLIAEWLSYAVKIIWLWLMMNLFIMFCVNRKVERHNIHISFPFHVLCIVQNVILSLTKECTNACVRTK